MVKWNRQLITSDALHRAILVQMQSQNPRKLEERTNRNLSRYKVTWFGGGLAVKVKFGLYDVKGLSQPG